MHIADRMQTPRTRSIASVFFVFATFPALFSTHCQANRPNVVIFLSDDQGYGDFSYTGNRDLATPNIDGLARDGAFVANFFVCPVCSPTRAEFLTGRYHPRGGVYSTGAGGERLDLDESTIADAFQAAGYATGAFGKWHNGMQAPYHPNTRGFGEYYGFCSGHWGNYFDPMLEHNGKIVRGNGYVVDDFTDHAMQFIEQHKDKPFFVYLPYNTPHSPMQVPDKYWDKFKDKELTQLPPKENKGNKKGKSRRDMNHCRAALAMCENIDHNVGRVLSKLDELKLADNTIVMYFCDNGPNGPRYNGGLKGRKGSTDEGGVHSPLFVRWPKKIRPNSTVETVSGAIDLYPTLAAACGVTPQNKKPFDGVSIHRELMGEKSEHPGRKFFSYWKDRLSVRTAQYRLDNHGVLYDILADKGQTKPVTDRPEIKQELLQSVEDWKKDVLVELDIHTKRRFVIGHPEMPDTQVPARDAEASGKIERSSRWPNCSFFRNWVDANDTISWPVTVAADGTFEVELYYCLAEEDVGTTLELSLGDQTITKTITTANVSPLIGTEHYRSERAESPVKNFKPITLGRIKLTKGVGKLVLRATEIPGKESIEFRLLMFHRLE